jgi:hypothetical protein
MASESLCWPPVGALSAGQFGVKPLLTVCALDKARTREVLEESLAVARW